MYKMDYGRMLHEHAANCADATVGCVEVPVEGASAFGVVETDPQGWVTRFEEKPRAPSASQKNPGAVLASMGIYVFNRDFLARCLSRDAADSASRHDFGRNVVPLLVGEARVYAHDLPRDGAQLGGDLFEDAELRRFSADGIALITRAAIERASERYEQSKIAYLGRRSCRE